MNIPEAYLRLDYQRARAWWGQLIDGAERRHGIPARLAYAVYSRETNLGRHWDAAPPATIPPGPTEDLLTYFIRNAGDGGHGRGIGQVDDRSHAIPDDWARDIDWQVDRSMEILAACLAAEGGDVVRAANHYNSGQGETARTTGKDYGPDVAERWQFIVREFPPTQEAPMVTAQSALDFYRRNDGLNETPPGSNVNWISEWYGMTGAWCAMTVSRALIAAGFGTPERIDIPGVSTTSAKGWAYVPYLRNDFIAAGRYDQTPKVGDVVIFAWGPGEPIGDHTGLLEQILDDGSFLTWEGNTDEGVIRRKRRTMAVINGFGHPPYSVAQAEQPEEETMIIVFDAPPERGGGVWQSNGIVRKPMRTGDTWPALGDDGAKVAKHIGVAPIGLFDDLIDIEAALAARIVVPAGGVEVDMPALAEKVADVLSGRLAS